MSVQFFVNGESREFDGPDDVPLLWVVREHFGLTGTKFSCGVAACGACTLHVDGQQARSCVLPVGSVRGKRVTTIEGLSKNLAHPVQRAWIALDVPQCGYCQPGMIMAVAQFLRDHPAPTDDDIDAGVTNLCRCVTYARVRTAIHAAAGRKIG